MKKTFLLLATASLFVACENTPKKEKISVNYPSTKKVDTSNTYFGSEVKDPYRWLEDDRSAETEAWVKAQNATTFGYLEKIPFRQDLKNRLEKLWNYEKLGSPFNEGEYTYYYKNDGLQNQYVVYRRKGEGEAEIFLDPNTFSEDGTTSRQKQISTSFIITNWGPPKKAINLFMVVPLKRSTDILAVV